MKYWVYIYGMLKGDFKPVDLSEDEMSNLLIDCWCAMNRKSESRPNSYEYFDARTGEVCYSNKPISVTITLKNPD